MLEFIIKNKIGWVSDEDADLIKQNWYTAKRHAYRWTKGSAKTRTRYAMHRLILERKLGRSLLDNEECDHIDRNPLNNQRDNLRVCSHAENACNVTKRSNTVSKYKGVYYDGREGRRKRWLAQIHHHGKHISLGCYMTEEEAGLAYNKAAVKIHGEFASLNSITKLSGVSSGS